MKNLNFIVFLLLVVSLVSCSPRVEKETSHFGKEQVDLSKENPLAQFSSTGDTSNLFETFSNYPKKKTDNKSKSKTPEDTSPIYYYVQVGITDSYEDISQLKNQIVTLFPDEKVEIKYDSPFYRVLIGPYNTKSKANEIFSILERKNFSSIRIRTETLK